MPNFNIRDVVLQHSARGLPAPGPSAFVILGFAVALCVGCAREPARPDRRDPASASPAESISSPRGASAPIRQTPASESEGSTIREAPFFAGAKSIPLSGQAVDVLEAGGGRFLIVRLKSPATLAVFDANALEIVQTLPLGNADCLVAAGRDVLIIVDPESGTCTRWSLKDWRRMPDVVLPVDLPIQSVALGSASNGPLLVVQNKNLRLPANKAVFEWPSPFVRFFNLDEMKPMQFKLHVAKKAMFDPINRGMAVASADGNTFVLNVGRTCLRLCDDTLVVRRIARSTSSILPGPDGQMIFGIQDPRFFNWHPLSTREDHEQRTAFPASRPPYYVTRESAIHFKSRKEAQRGNGVCVMAPGEDEPLFWTKRQSTNVGCHFLVQSKLLALIDSGDKARIDLFYVDLNEALRKRSGPYLFFTSSPPLETRPGTEFRYAAAWTCSRQDIRFELDQAPADMTVTATGVVAWSVPRDQPAGYLDFRLIARSSDGLERQQWISLYCHESR
jgi:hypothetical protein